MEIVMKGDIIMSNFKKEIVVDIEIIIF